MLSIKEMVDAEFGGLHEGEAAALAKLDEVAGELATLPDDVLALTLAGLIKATADKKAGATVMSVIKQLVPAVVKLM